jgi:death on curing protein
MRDLWIAHHVLAEFFADDPEPIPAWDEGDAAKLEMCRACIEVQSCGVLKYPDVPSAAAKLFYSTIKLHAFPNGNKRFALVLTVAFILNNGLMFTAPRASARIPQRQ